MPCFKNTFTTQFFQRNGQQWGVHDIYWAICCAARFRCMTSLFPIKLMKMLSKFFEDISIDIWPPRSPNLTPIDYFLCGCLKDEVFCGRPKNLVNLKARIEGKVQSIDIHICNGVLRWVQIWSKAALRPYEATSAWVVWTTPWPEAITSCVAQMDPSAIGIAKWGNK